MSIHKNSRKQARLQHFSVNFTGGLERALFAPKTSPRHYAAAIRIKNVVQFSLKQMAGEIRLQAVAQEGNVVIVFNVRQKIYLMRREELRSLINYDGCIEFLFKICTDAASRNCHL